MAPSATARRPAGGRGALVRVRRRNGPLAAAGVLLVAGCALAFTLAWLRAGDRLPVLAVAHPVAAGQVLTAADLQVVRVSVGGPVTLVPASQEPDVAGHAASTALPAGSLLAAGDIGAPPPAAGQAVLGVAVKPGQYPPDLAAGDTVDVLALPGGPAGGPGPGGSGQVALPAGQAVVVSVTPQAAPGQTVVEIRVSQDAMPQVAAAAADGQIDLAAVPAGGGVR